MSTAASKRLSISNTSRAGVCETRTVMSSPFPADAVEQATDLGDGYVIVKLSSLCEPSTEGGPVVPAIPHTQMRRVIARALEIGMQVPPPLMSKQPVETAPENNSGLLATMEEKALSRRQQLHQQGKLLASAQICDRLGISRAALSKAVRDRRMFWVEGSSGTRWYPSFFADGMTSRRDLERVSQALADMPGAVKWQFFTTPKHSLDGRVPIEAIRRGELEQVLRSAAEFMERNLGR